MIGGIRGYICLEWRALRRALIDSTYFCVRYENRGLEGDQGKRATRQLSARGEAKTYDPALRAPPDLEVSSLNAMIGRSRLSLSLLRLANREDSLWCVIVSKDIQLVWVLEKLIVRWGDTAKLIYFISIISGKEARLLFLDLCNSRNSLGN